MNPSSSISRDSRCSLTLWLGAGGSWLKKWGDSTLLQIITLSLHIYIFITLSLHVIPTQGAQMSFQNIYLTKYFCYSLHFLGNRNITLSTEEAWWAINYSITGIWGHQSSVPIPAILSDKLHHFDFGSSHKALGTKLRPLTLNIVDSFTLCCTRGRNLYM